MEEHREADAREKAERERDYVLVDAKRIATEQDVLQFLPIDSMLVDDSAVASAHLEVVAALKDVMREWNDIVSELSEVEKLEAARQILDSVRTIEGLGYIAQALVRNRSMQAPDGNRIGLQLGVIRFAPAPTDGTELPMKVYLPRRMRFA